jgi:hypothetical protein
VQGNCRDQLESPNRQLFKHTSCGLENASRVEMESLFRACRKIGERDLHFQGNPRTAWGAVNISPLCSTTLNFRVLSQKNVSKPANVCVEELQASRSSRNGKVWPKRREGCEDVHLMHLNTATDDT